MGEAQADTGGERDGREGRRVLGGGWGRLKSRGKRKDSDSGSRASGLGDADGPGLRGGSNRPESGPAQAAVPAVGSRPEPRPQGPQAALRGGSSGEGSRSERQRSRVCVFIIIISD